MKIVTSILLCMASIAAFAKADPWKIHDFSFNLPAGFSRIHTSDAFQLVNAKGIGVTIDALPPNQNLNPAQQIEKWTSYAETEIPQIAKRHGTITSPLRSAKLPSGNILYVLEESGKKVGNRKSFGLFFVLISPQGRIAQFVFEGPGTPDAALAKYLPYVTSASWLPSPNSSSKRTR